MFLGKANYSQLKSRGFKSPTYRLFFKQHWWDHGTVECFNLPDIDPIVLWEWFAYKIQSDNLEWNKLPGTKQNTNLISNMNCIWPT